jgi:branched-chain amino acid transport system ATP-binding protein
MLVIGRALMSHPRLLMMDEPSLGLAPSVVSTVFDSIRRLIDEGMTVLLVEQNVRKSLELAHRGYVLENGRIVLSGDSANLLADQQVKRAYLGV